MRHSVDTFYTNQYFNVLSQNLTSVNLFFESALNGQDHLNASSDSAHLLVQMTQFFLQFSSHLASSGFDNDTDSNLTLRKMLPPNPKYLLNYFALKNIRSLIWN